VEISQLLTCFWGGSLGSWRIPLLATSGRLEPTNAMCRWRDGRGAESVYERDAEERLKGLEFRDFVAGAAIGRAHFWLTFNLLLYTSVMSLHAAITQVLQWLVPSLG